MSSMFVSGLSARKIQTRSFTMQRLYPSAEDEPPSPPVIDAWAVRTEDAKAKRDAKHREWAAESQDRLAQFTHKLAKITHKQPPDHSQSAPPSRRAVHEGWEERPAPAGRLVEALVPLKVRKAYSVASPAVRDPRCGRRCSCVSRWHRCKRICLWLISALPSSTRPLRRQPLRRQPRH